MSKSAIIFRLAFFASLTPFCDSVAAHPKVGEAVARAVPYIVEQGGWWINEKQCVSCHHVAFTTWTLLEADQRGFQVDREQLLAWRNWARDDLIVPDQPDAPPRGTTNREGASQLLLGERARNASVLNESDRVALVRFLIEGQRDDGTWNAGGQLPSQKRPQSETELVSTAWNALALGTVEVAGAAEARNKALAAIESASDEGVSTEWFAIRLLLAVESASAADIQRWMQELRARQRGDGGWGWLVTADGDAMATGQVLYALRAAGLPKDDPTVLRAVEFLVESQTPSGRWLVNGTKEKSKDMPAETASYWGTCWAVLGLLSALDVEP